MNKRTRLLRDQCFTPFVSALMMVLGLYISTPSVAAVPNTDSYQASILQLDAAMKQVDGVMSAIDLSQLDPMMLVAKLEADPAKLITFVRQQIAYEPYPGTLRGAKGTLMARAGNTLDQSILLAMLLNNSGYEARINYTPLKESLAQQVLSQAQMQVRSPPAEVDASLLETTNTHKGAAKKTAFTQRLHEAMQSPVYAGAQAATMTTWLVDELKKAGVVLGNNKAARLPLEWTKSYFWVQYRSDPWAKWLTVQPVFVSADDELPSLAAEERLYSKIPRKWQWLLDLKLEVETKVGDRLHTKTLLKWKRPLANLAGRPLSISVAPTNLSSRAALKNLEKTFAEAQLFSASFNGDSSGPLFDLNGNFVDQMVLSDGSNAASLFMTTNKKTQAATNKLAALGVSDNESGNKKPPFQALTGVWVDVMLLPPGRGKKRSARRFLLDRIGDVQRQSRDVSTIDATEAGDMARQLTVNYVLLASGGKPAAGLMLQRRMQLVKGLRPLYQYGLELGHLNKDNGVTLAQFMTQQKPAAVGQMALLYDSATTIAGQPKHYRPAPNVVVYENGFGANFNAKKETDILFNPVMALQASNNSALPMTALAAGVNMTRLETVRRSHDAKGATHRSAYSALDAARVAGIPLEVIAPGQNSAGWQKINQKLAELKLPRASEDAVLRDLHENFVVVIAQRQVADNIAWWRVAPDSGETLGMAGDGRGSEVVEYDGVSVVMRSLLNSLNNVYGVQGTMKSVIACADSAKPNCCLQGIAGNAAIGAGIGNRIGKMPDKLAGAITGAVLSLGNASFIPDGVCL